MRKLMLFFITLFITFFSFIPSFLALDNPLVIIDFRSQNSTEPYVNWGVEFLRDKTVPAKATWTESDGTVTFYNAFVDLIQKLDDAGYYFVITADFDETNADISGYPSLIGGYGSSPSVGDYDLWVIDSKRTDVEGSDSVVLRGLIDEHKDEYYSLYMNDGSNFAVYRNVLNSTDNEGRGEYCYGCSFDTFVEYMNTTDSTLYSKIDLVQERELNLLSLPVYSNIQFSFDFHDDRDANITVYTDYSNSPIEIIDGFGWRFDQYFYMLNYVTGQNVNPDYNPDDNPDTPPIPDEPPSTSDTILDTNTGGSENQIGGFFDDFKNDNHGLSDIITAPLEFINHLLDTKCTPLTFPLPFTDVKGSLPCMSDIYTNYFGDIYLLYQEITTGIIAYWVLANMFRIMKNMKDPNNSEIEVMDL